MACGITTQILGNWCIGDSLPVINENFEKLESYVCNLSANTIYTTDTSTVSLSFDNISRSLEANVNNKSITNAKLAFDEGSYGYRNKLINGAFDFWQRGTSFSGISPASIQYTADRWGVVGNGNTLNITQGIFSSSFPSSSNTDFFNPDYYLKLSITNAPNSTNRPTLTQRIEDARTFAGRKVTLSFYASTTMSGSSSRQLRFSLIQKTSTGATPSSYIHPGITNVLINQWKKYEVTLTVPSVPAGVIPDNDSYLELNIIPEAAVGDFMITGVQLEAGEHSTAYEVKPRAVELKQCQRFFEKSYDAFVDPGTATKEGAGLFSCNSTGDFKLASVFQTTKRGDLDVTKSLCYEPQTASTTGAARQIGSGALNVVLDTDFTSTRQIVFKPSSGTSANSNAVITWHYVADAEFYL